ncbi:MAG: GerMN domain-containing protein [Propionibacteriaceae bacterium]|nr:GerMN domain-containing protein [Propionibacteriaceae bacterium]
MRFSALFVVLLAVVLSSCTHLPISGPVVEVSVSPQGRGVQIAPEPPGEGMSPARIVEGFLQAMSDPTGNYAVARQYLAAPVAQSWEPGQQTLIYDGTPSEVDGSQVLQATVRGQLDAEGRFQVLRAELNHDFELVEQDGEWRIGAAPEGVLLSGYIFNRSYAVVKSYFMARSGQSVIADLVHVPALELTPERVLRAQFLGPSAELARVTHSAIPAGVTLGRGGATVDSEGVVSVDLAGLPGDLPDEARRALGAQLLWSLASIPRVTGLRVNADGVPWAIPGQNTNRVLELSSQQGYQPLSRATAVDLVGVRETRLGRLSPERNFVPLAGDGEPLDMAALSLDGALIAYVSSASGQVRIGPVSGALATFDSAVRAISSVQFAAGQLWLLGVDETGWQRLATLSPQGEVRVIDTSALPGRIVDVAVDPAGIRVGVLLEIDGQVQFGMALVDQARQLSPWVRLSPVVEGGEALTGFTALDWTSESELAVIARAGAGASVFVMRIDGSAVSDIGPVVGEPVQVTALPRPGGDSVAIRHADGQVMVHSAHHTWQSASEPFDWISYPS